MQKKIQDLTYYNSLKPPLLLQGFDTQLTSLIPIVLEDRKVFTTRVNRGVVNFLDFLSFQRVQTASGIKETDFNATQLSITAGGQEVLKDDPADRYNYAYDIGDRDEQKIPILINGGQQIISKLFLPDLVSNANSDNYSGQLLAYYTTKLHDQWLKENAHFNSGLGLKRQSYRAVLPLGSTGSISIDDVIPKNQGKVIGFSFLTMGVDLESVKVNFQVDDLGLIENVAQMRFSRFSQRDPFIFWNELNPGSTFNLELKVDTGSTTVSINQCWITLYFNN